MHMWILLHHTSSEIALVHALCLRMEPWHILGTRINCKAFHGNPSPFGHLQAIYISLYMPIYIINMYVKQHCTCRASLSFDTNTMLQCVSEAPGHHLNLRGPWLCKRTHPTVWSNHICRWPAGFGFATASKLVRLTCEPSKTEQLELEAALN